MSRVLAVVTAGSRLWGTHCNTSDKEITTITYPTDQELTLGHRPLSTVATTPLGTTTTWSTLKFHTLVRNLNPDALAFLLELAKDPWVELKYASLLHKYIEILQSPVVVEKIKHIIATAARNRALNELRKPLGAKEVMNVAYFAELLWYTKSEDFRELKDYKYNFALLVGNNSLFSSKEYNDLVEARNTGRVVSVFLVKAREYCLQNEYLPPTSYQMQIDSAQKELDAAYSAFIKQTFYTNYKEEICY